jgi:hypothetical protein
LFIAVGVPGFGYHFRELMTLQKDSRSVLEELLLPAVEHSRPQAHFLTQIRDWHFVQKVPPQNGYLLFSAVMLSFFPHTFAPLS